MAFPVYFEYDGGGSPPADFRADDLLISGTVSGTGVRFDYGRSEDCIELEELILDVTGNSFTYEIEGEENIPYGDQGSPMRLQLSDLSGKVVWQREESCSPGANVWKAPLDKLPPGIYFASLNQSVFRFVKN